MSALNEIILYGGVSITDRNLTENGDLTVAKNLTVSNILPFVPLDGLNVCNLNIDTSAISAITGNITFNSNVDMNNPVIINDTLNVLISIKTDTLLERTNGAGVSINNMVLKQNSITTTGDISINNRVIVTDINDAVSSSSGGSLIVNGGISVAKKVITGLSITAGTDITVNNVLYTGHIQEKTTSAGVIIGSIHIQDDNITSIFPSTKITFNRNLDVTQKLTVSNTTASSSTTTGALLVAGGAGIVGDLYAANIYSNGVLVGSGGGGPSYTAGTNINITGVVLSVVSNPTFSGITTVSNTTNSTSTTTGALLVAGGVGVAGDLYAANIYSNGALVGTGGGGGPTYTAGTNINITGSILSVISNPTFSGITTISNATASTTSTTGALIVTGGVGVGGNIVLNNTRIRASAEPLISTDVATKNYVDTHEMVTYNIAFNNSISTTSTSFITLTGMSLSLTDGTYSIFAFVEGLTTGNINYALYLDNTVVPNTTVNLTGEDSSYSITVNITVVGTQVLTIRWATTAGLRTVSTRSLMALKTSSSLVGGGTGNIYTAGTNISIVLDTISVISNPTFSGITTVSNTTASSSTTTGALLVAGGAGIVGDLYASNIYSNGVLVSNSPTYTAGTNINITGTVVSVISTPSFSGITTISNATASSTTTTGALIVTGGVGIGGAIFSGGTIQGTSFQIGGTQVLSSTTLGSGITASSLTSVGTLTGLTSSGAVSVTSSASSSSTTSGALIVTGGAGIGGAVNIGGATRILNATASTTTTTGALIVTGGVGIGGALFSGSTIQGTSYQIGGTAVLTSSALGSGVTSSSLTSVGTLTGLTSSGAVSITSSTATSSPSSGALIVTGGVGIGGALFSGGTIQGTSFQIGGTAVLTSSALGSGVTSSSLTSVGTLTGLTSSGAVSITSSASSSSTTTGALIVTGGVGVGGALFSGGTIQGTSFQIGGTTVLSSTALGSGITGSSLTSVGTLTGLTSSGAVSITNATASTSFSTGSLIISGGAGVSGDIYLNNTRIRNSADPLVSSDVATKNYVDTKTPQNFSVIQNNTINTTSTSYILMTDMVLTLTAGNYIISACVNSNSTGNISYALFLNNNIIANSELSCSGEDSSYAINNVITIVSTQNIDIRWKTSGGTRNVSLRTLVATKFN